MRKVDGPKLWALEDVPPSRDALVCCDGSKVGYGELAARTAQFAAQLGPKKSLLLLEPQNDIASVVAFLGALRGGHAVSLIPPDNPAFSARVEAAFRPEWHYRREGGSWVLDRSTREAAPLHPELAVLLPTSGSTGDAKFVRLSAENLASNAASIAEYLALQDDDRGLLSLPFHYSYGMSIVTSHLAAGATVLLTERSLSDPKLWRFFETEMGTGLAGVPYSFELLEAVRFSERALPHLRRVTQAGGRLPAERVRHYARLGAERGWRFFVMYGQTEASPRMAYLPPELAEQFPDCIGRAIPGGRLFLADSEGTPIEGPGVEGELCYEGPNVMLGYAHERADLQRGREINVLRTGDLATRNEAGLFGLQGRKSRFIKPFGQRIALDQLESLLAARGWPVAAGGSDEALVVLTLDAAAAPLLARAIAQMLALPQRVIHVHVVEAFPRLASGKLDTAAINRLAAAEAPSDQLAAARAAQGSAPAPAKADAADPSDEASIQAAFARIFATAKVQPEDSFASLGGDSLSYVEASMVLERVLGHVPEGWEAKSVERLQAMRRKPSTWQKVEAATLLRALGIFLVVAGHFKLLKFSGGAYMLLIVSGFNFARFQLPRVIETGSTRTIWSSLARIALPTVFMVAVMHLFYRRWEPEVLLLVSNWFDPRGRTFVGFWYLEVLIQVCLVLALVLAAPRVRRWAQSSPLQFGYAVVLVSVLLVAVVPLFWDTKYLYQRVPHMLLWLFAFGWCSAYAQRAVEKAVTVITFVACASWWFHGGLGGLLKPSSALLLGGLAIGLLTLNRGIFLPGALRRVIYPVAASSLFIFLAHGPTITALHKAGVKLGPGFDVLVGLAAGIAFWQLWEHGSRALGRWWAVKPRLRRARAAAIH